ncbi:MAG: hypothetical protein Q4Q25_00985 [Methanocorpusculum sp.]|nr:hypothetical protein [Methanocorpusculum sp.]
MKYTAKMIRYRHHRGRLTARQRNNPNYERCKDMSEISSRLVTDGEKQAIIDTVVKYNRLYIRNKLNKFEAGHSLIYAVQAIHQAYYDECWTRGDCVLMEVDTADIDRVTCTVCDYFGFDARAVLAYFEDEYCDEEE